MVVVVDEQRRHLPRDLRADADRRHRAEGAGGRDRLLQIATLDGHETKRLRRLGNGVAVDEKAGDTKDGKDDDCDDRFAFHED
jgi:hypothetical protein